MPSFSSEWLRAYEARNLHPDTMDQLRSQAESESEGKLHDEIAVYCLRRQWAVIHSRMDKATTNAKGVPDFIIFADNGRVFIVECKSATGKMRPEQLGFKLLVEMKGHTYHIVRSMEQFLAVIQSGPEAAAGTSDTPQSSPSLPHTEA